jgi:hypothetical protein
VTTDLERIELAFRRAISRLAGNGPMQFGLQVVADELLRVIMEKPVSTDENE